MREVVLLARGARELGKSLADQLPVQVRDWEPASSGPAVEVRHDDDHRDASVSAIRSASEETVLVVWRDDDSFEVLPFRAAEDQPPG